jgi:hypothetical protein
MAHSFFDCGGAKKSVLLSAVRQLRTHHGSRHQTAKRHRVDLAWQQFVNWLLAFFVQCPPRPAHSLRRFAMLRSPVAQGSEEVANLFSATVETLGSAVVLGFVRLGLYRSSCATNAIAQEGARHGNAEQIALSNGDTRYAKPRRCYREIQSGALLRRQPSPNKSPTNSRSNQAN